MSSRKNNQIIQVKINSNNELTVSSRELYKGLQIVIPYQKWLRKVCSYGYIQNRDYYESHSQIKEKNYIISFDMAKEVALLEKNKKSMQIRNYLIEVAKINKQIYKLDKEAKNKILFADCISLSCTGIFIGDMAKLLRQTEINIGRNRLFKWLRKNNYLIESGYQRNMPTQYSIEKNLLKITERAICCSNGQIYIKKIPTITGKGQIYFVNLFLSLNLKNKS